MVEFISEQDDILGRRKHWSVGAGKALVSYGGKTAGVWFYDLPEGRSGDIARTLMARGHPITLQASIDCEVIDCPLDHVDALLAAAERIIASA